MPNVFVLWKPLRNILFVLLSLLPSAFAHKGVTYPIAVDRPISTEPTSSHLSVVVDPDLGEGTLTFIFREPVDFQTVQIHVIGNPEGRPEERREAPAVFSEENKQFVAKVPFHMEGRWQMQMKIEQNGKLIESFELPVDIVPPGPSRREFALYAMPFVAMALLGLRVLFYQRKKLKARAASLAKN